MILHITVMITRLYAMKKDMEGSRINDVIQYGNNILTL